MPQKFVKLLGHIISLRVTFASIAVWSSQVFRRVLAMAIVLAAVGTAWPFMLSFFFFVAKYVLGRTPSVRIVWRRDFVVVGKFRWLRSLFVFRRLFAIVISLA